MPQLFGTGVMITKNKPKKKHIRTSKKGKQFFAGKGTEKKKLYHINYVSKRLAEVQAKSYRQTGYNTHLSRTMPKEHKILGLKFRSPVRWKITYWRADKVI